MLHKTVAIIAALVAAVSATVLVPQSHVEAASVTASAAPATSACDTQATGEGMIPVLQLEIQPTFSLFNQPPAYSVDDTAKLGGSFDRVGYCLDLKTSNSQQWVWASMKPATSDVSKLGLPTGAGSSVQSRVTELTVATNVSGITTGPGQSGYVEMWPNRYLPATSAGASGASSANFDADDTSIAGGSYGSFQVHADATSAAPRTVLAINHFAADSTNAGPVDIGIGNRPNSANTDWTFAGNAGSYATRTLTVYARPGSACAAKAQAEGLIPIEALEVPASASLYKQPPGYRFVNTLAVASGFDRVGYCLDLKSASAQQWVWSSMEPFTTDANKLGLPTMPDQVIRQRVDDLTVDSNVAGVVTSSGQTGWLEMWPYAYTQTASREVANASGSIFDADDRPFTTDPYTASSPKDLYGSFQVHAIGALQASSTVPHTVFAINRFTATGAAVGALDIGIGDNAASANTDWTFRGNTADWSAGRTLTVYARPSSVALTVTVDSPADRKLYARDAANHASVPISGTVTAPGINGTRLTVSKNGVAQPPISQSGTSFAYSPQIEAGLWSYDFLLQTTVNGVVQRTVGHWTDIVAGDAYFIQGQSNAQAAAYSASVPTSPLESQFIRSFGTNSRNDSAGYEKALGAADMVWNYAAQDKEFDLGAVGQWGLQMASTLVNTQGVPVAIINGSYGGAKIAGYARPDAPNDMQRDNLNPQNIETVYGRALLRLEMSGLAKHLTGVFYYQGEADASTIYGGLADPAVGGGNGWVVHFLGLLASWRTDFAGARGPQPRYYVVQIRNAPCIDANYPTRDPRGIDIRDAQRLLPTLDSAIQVLSTSALPDKWTPNGQDGCHFNWAGYQSLGIQAAELVQKDIFQGPSVGVVAPNAASAAWVSPAKNQIIVQLQSTDPLTVVTGAAANFQLTQDSGGTASTATVTNVQYQTGGQLLLTLSRSAPEVVGLAYAGSVGNGPIIATSARGVGLLAFWLRSISG